MGILAAMGAFNTAVSFTGTAMSLAQSDNPEDAIATLLGIGGEEGMSIDALHGELMNMMARSDLFMYQGFLAGPVGMTKTALTQLDALGEVPSETERSTILDNAVSGLKGALALADLARGADSPELTAAAFGAVSIALQGRIAVVEGVQDGAFARSSIRDEIDEAVDVLDGLRSDMLGMTRPEISIDEKDAFEFWGHGTTFGPGDQVDFIVDSSMPSHIVQRVFDRLPDYDYTNGPDSDHVYRVDEDKIVYVSAHDIHVADNGDTTQTIHAFDMGDHADGRVPLMNWIKSEITREIREDAGWGQHGEDFPRPSELYGDLANGGREIAGTGEGDVIEPEAVALPTAFATWYGIETDHTTMRGDDFVNAHDGNDTVDGGAGDDVILGGNGADWLEGGAGADVLYAGSRDAANPYAEGHDDFSDSIVFRDLDAVDTVKQFNAGHPDETGDLLVLDGTVFDALGDAVTAADFFEGSIDDDYGTAHIVRDGSSLYYDADGHGGADAIQFATLVEAGSLGVENFDII